MSDLLRTRWTSQATSTGSRTPSADLKSLYERRIELRSLRDSRRWQTGRKGPDLRKSHPRRRRTDDSRFSDQLDAQKLHLAHDVWVGLLRDRNDVDGRIP